MAVHRQVLKKVQLPPADAIAHKCLIVIRKLGGKKGASKRGVGNAAPQTPVALGGNRMWLAPGAAPGAVGDVDHVSFITFLWLLLEATWL